MSDASQVSASRTINAPVERVWRVATDLKSIPETMSAITDVEVVSGAAEEFDVGTRWRETRMMMKREATEEMEVTAVAPLRSYTVEADNHGVHYTSEFAFEPVGDGQTRVTMTFKGESQSKQNVIQRMMGKLGLRVVRKSLEQDLADLASAAEGTDEPVNPT